jgi:hypothetical protein
MKHEIEDLLTAISYLISETIFLCVSEPLWLF